MGRTDIFARQLLVLLQILVLARSGVFANFFESQDVERGTILQSSIAIENFKYLQEKFYEVTSRTFSQSCSVIKHFGGEWIHSDFRAAEGSKAVCMDKFLSAVKEGRCLIYSFGIARDWSFEDAMDSLGCKVKAFDPTIDAPKRRSPNVTFEKIGIAQESGYADIAGNQRQPVMKFQDILEKNGDMNKNLTYVKLDVEGWEIEFLPKWAKKKFLNNIEQVGVELHMGRDDDARRYSKLIKTFQQFYKKGFRLVSYTPNFIQEKFNDFEQKYHTHFDILLVKMK